MRSRLNRKRIAIVVAGAAVFTDGTVGTPGTLSGDDGAQERPIPAADLALPERAALEATGGDELREAEVGDEESKYEVQVTVEDGMHVDVHLDVYFDAAATE